MAKEGECSFVKKRLAEELHCIVRHTLPGVLFQTALGEKNWLAIESRKEENIYLTILDLDHGQVIKEYAPSVLTPWHSLMGIENKKIIFQHFEDRQNPDKVALYALNLTNNELSKVSNWQPSTAVLPNTPALFLPDTDAFNMVVNFLGESIELGCEYMETNETIVLGSHVRQNTNRFIRRIHVIKQGKNALSIIQDKDLKGFAPGSFFTFKKRLIFARDKREINIYEI